MEDEKRTPIIALWERESKKGKYFSGKLTTKAGDIQIVLFPNSFKKEGDNKPNWLGYKSVPKEEQSQELGNLE